MYAGIILFVILNVKGRRRIIRLEQNGLIFFLGKKLKTDARTVLKALIILLLFNLTLIGHFSEILI